MIIKPKISTNIISFIILFVFISLISIIPPRPPIQNIIFGLFLFFVIVFLVIIGTVSTKLILSDDGIIKLYIFGCKVRSIDVKNIILLKKQYLFPNIIKGFWAGNALFVVYKDNNYVKKFRMGFNAYGGDKVKLFIDYIKKYKSDILVEDTIKN